MYEWESVIIRYEWEGVIIRYEWESVIIWYKWGLFMIFMLFLYRLCCCKAANSMRSDLFSVRKVFSVKPSPLQGRPFCFVEQKLAMGKNKRINVKTVNSAICKFMQYIVICEWNGFVVFEEDTFASIERKTEELLGISESTVPIICVLVDVLYMTYP